MSPDAPRKGPRLLDRNAASAWARELQAQAMVVVFTNGCFDILHPGHAHLLERAAACGDRLIVGLNGDDSVRRLKGPSRPVFPAQERARMLLGLRWVDAVVVFEEDTPRNLIRSLQPDVLVKGGDYRPDEVAGAGDMERWGGRVVIIPLLPGFSSSAVLEAAARALDGRPGDC